jgi:hypothetical protein
MGKKSSSAPDPYATAAAQTQSNQQTAAYNAALNRTDQITPYGSSIYTQKGVDSTGAPIWSNTISLTPLAQSQLDNQLKQNDQLSDLGFTLADQAKQQISTPYTDGATSGDAAADAYYARQQTYLDPQWNQQQSNLDAKLANQGVVQGSDAYNRAQDNLARQRTQAYDVAQEGAIQQGQSQQQIALANQSTLKTSALNQLNALRSGTQIQNPSFSAAPSSTAATTDISGDIYKSAQLNASNSNNFMNGLFSLGSAAIMASDRRLKRGIRRAGLTPVMRLPVYEFAYAWAPDERVVGVMADEVARIAPHAVLRHPSGYRMVDYRMVA